MWIEPDFLSVEPKCAADDRSEPFAGTWGEGHLTGRGAESLAYAIGDMDPIEVHPMGLEPFHSRLGDEATPLRLLPGDENAVLDLFPYGFWDDVKEACQESASRFPHHRQ